MHGHPDAWEYPVGTVMVEFTFVEAHLNSMVATQTLLIQAALSTILGGTKARKSFEKTIKKLQNIE